MSHEGDLTEGGIDAYLNSHQRKSLLRFITCGSVDDGKSTLIGRLLFASHLIFEDQLAALAADSLRLGTQGNELDLALLTDGLAAEREQGITIDVAYRYFATDRRKFIVADTPGHEQYTRNMVTGASTADAAVILVDARKGVLTQTRRHSYVVSALGIDRVVVAVNKMDLVGWDQSRFEETEGEYRRFAEQIGIPSVSCIPLSALTGDNVVERSAEMSWYSGPTLLEWLESAEIADASASRPFRLPIQHVSRPHHDFRGFAGRIVAGTVLPGDQVVVLPSGTRATVARLVTMDGDLTTACAGQSIVVTLAEEVDASRGDVLCAADSPAGVADQFEALVVWMHEQPMLPGRQYLVNLGTSSISGSIGHPKYRVDVNSLEHLAAATLGLNEIGVCNVALDQPVPFDQYSSSREMGAFTIIDKRTHVTVGAGMIRFALRRSGNIGWQNVQIDKTARNSLNRHLSTVVWFTGLSGSGKSTIANLVESQLYAEGLRTYLLDGDNIRHGLNRDLGFTDADRVENIRRVAEVAALMSDAGLVVLVAFISPFQSERQLARERVAEGEFIEVHVDATLDVAEARDPKGLYSKARRGELRNFTGIDSPYEPPDGPEVYLDTTSMTPVECAERVVEAVLARRAVSS